MQEQLRNSLLLLLLATVVIRVIAGTLIPFLMFAIPALIFVLIVKIRR